MTFKYNKRDDFLRWGTRAAWNTTSRYMPSELRSSVYNSGLLLLRIWKQW